MNESAFNQPRGRFSPREIGIESAVVLAIAAATWARWPLVEHAEAHLDSDLAVDGLTLLEWLQGHWRWHFPGTPRIGILPLSLCLPQTLWGGLNAASLVSGGLVAYALVVLSTFVLARRAFGDRAAVWGLVPLAFSSNGAVWLSGRLTGGHLLSVAWHAWAFAMLHACLSRGGARRGALLGIWVGLGLYVDAMFIFSIFGIAAATFLWSLRTGLSRAGLSAVCAFLLGTAAGFAPSWIGARVDPRDDYPDQFAPTFNPELLWGHTGILVYECLPRLICGRLLPGLHTEPSPRAVGNFVSPFDSRPESIAAPTFCGTSLALFLVGLTFVTIDPDGKRLPKSEKASREAVRAGIVVASAGTVVAFVVNLHIYNSDNYRYLVYLLVPWSLGFGLTMEWLTRRGLFPAALVLAAALAALSTIEETRWLEGLGWSRKTTGGERVSRATVESRIRTWLDEHPSVDYIVSDYWLVYRSAFLTRGKIKGRPYGGPNRFPEWGDGGDRPGRRVLILIPLPRGRPPFEGSTARKAALEAGGKLLDRIGGAAVYSWPAKPKPKR